MINATSSSSKSINSRLPLLKPLILSIKILKIHKTYILKSKKAKVKQLFTRRKFMNLRAKSMN